MNPLYNSNMQNIMNRFQQFKNMFSGNPQQQIQQMLNTGQITQSQYNDAVQKANELYRMMKNT